MRIFGTDYSKIDRFQRIGFDYTKAYEDDNYLVWRMSKEGVSNYSVEVWKKRWRKQPDGTLYLHAPKDEEFGVSGWYFVGSEASVKSQLLDRFKIALI